MYIVKSVLWEKQVCFQYKHLEVLAILNNLFSYVFRMPLAYTQAMCNDCACDVLRESTMHAT